MAESIEIKCSHVPGGIIQIQKSDFRALQKEFKMMFLLRRIKNKMLCHHFMMTSKTLCHAELVSASHVVETLPHEGQAHKAHTSPVRFVKQVQNDKELKP